jgi:DNA-binding MarR family transcriptional regulator
MVYAVSVPEVSMNDISDARHRDIARGMDCIRAMTRAMRINSRAIEKEIGLSLAQLFVVNHLAERPAASLADLAARTSTHQSSVSVVVDRLVSRGLVTRRPSIIDRRRAQLALTPEGLRVYQRAPETILTTLIKAMQSFSTAEQSRLAQLLHKMITLAEIDLGERHGRAAARRAIANSA